MSPRYIGLRVHWNRSTNQFLLRNGNTLSPPRNWPAAYLPTELNSLDAILCFDENTGNSNTIGEDINWNTTQMIIIDSPNDNRRYEERILAIERSLSDEHRGNNIRLAERKKCNSVQELYQYLEQPEQQLESNRSDSDSNANSNILKGVATTNGVILREAGSYYQVGRSTTLYELTKVPPFLISQILIRLDQIR